MAVDCIDLVRLWTVRCDADRFRHARGRHAPRLGIPVRDNGRFVAAVGIGDAVCAAPRAPIPSGEIEAILRVDRARRRLRRHRTDFRRLDDVAGSPIQPVCRPFAPTAVRAPLVRQVLQRDALVSGTAVSYTHLDVYKRQL